MEWADAPTTARERDAPSTRERPAKDGLARARVREHTLAAMTETLATIAALVKENEVVLFMKGTRHAPQCGFSARVVDVLDEYLPEY
ncbi:MAG: hypothetical protein MUE69_23890, partial [Myxococcota bacterium]|nr:hypothetical protein [Myxococcota bacterium]